MDMTQPPKERGRSSVSLRLSQEDCVNMYPERRVKIK